MIYSLPDKQLVSRTRLKKRGEAQGASFMGTAKSKFGTAGSGQTPQNTSHAGKGVV